MNVFTLHDSVIHFDISVKYFHNVNLCLIKVLSAH